MSQQKVFAASMLYDRPASLKNARLLVMASNPSTRIELTTLLEPLGCSTQTFDYFQSDPNQFRTCCYDLIIVDLDGSAGGPAEQDDVLSILTLLGDLQWQKALALIPVDRSEQVGELLRLGISRYLLKPTHPDEVLQAVKDQLEIVLLKEAHARMTDHMKARYHIDNIIGISAGARHRRSFVRAFAELDQPVFISGERGVGKEMVARTLHYSSSRSGLPFIFIDTTILPPAGLDSLLFGTASEQPIGSYRSTPGLIELAKGGTIYLTEASLIPASVQFRLAAAMRIPETTEPHAQPLPARFMFASQFVPEQLKRKGTLVDELFQQVRDAHLAIEPLRHRVEDIPLLAERFVEQICQEHGKEIRDLTDDAIDALKQFNWPENVSQLRDMIYLAVMRTKPQAIDETVLPEPVGRRATQAPKVTIPEEGIEFYEVVGELERALVGSALKITAGNQRRAAQLLRLKETTFAAMRKRLGLR